MKKRRTPGDRRQASPVGEELVPRRKNGPRPDSARRGVSSVNETGPRQGLLRSLLREDLHEWAGLAPVQASCSVHPTNAGQKETCAACADFFLFSCRSLLWGRTRR